MTASWPSSTVAKQSILGVGLVCLDVIKADGAPRYFNGGSCGNVISGLAFLGWKASIVTPSYKGIGGKIVMTNLAKLGISQIKTEPQLMEVPRIIECLKMKNDIYVDHKYLFVCPECGQKLPSIAPLDDASAKKITNNAQQFNVLYADRTSAGIKILRKVFQDRGNWTIYEPNSSRNIEGFLQNSLDSHIVKFSTEKVSLSLAEKLRNRAALGSTVLIVHTDGEEGLHFSYRMRNATMSKWAHLRAQPVSHLIDASGAGDWCTVGLIMGLVGKYRNSKCWLSREEVVAALQYGQALSAISCAFIGAQGLIYAETDDIIREQVFKGLKKGADYKIRPTSISKDMIRDLCKLCLLPV